MTEKRNHTSPVEAESVSEPERYQPRPWWQVWGARILVVTFIVLVILYYITIARGVI